MDIAPGAITQSIKYKWMDGWLGGSLGGGSYRAPSGVNKWSQYLY